MQRHHLILTVVLALAACQPSARPPLTGTGMDMFAPANLRIHPLSRILPAPPATQPTVNSLTPAGSQATSQLLEARIELLDQFSDTTRSPGTLTLQLFDQPPLLHKGTLLHTWTFSLDT